MHYPRIPNLQPPEGSPWGTVFAAVSAISLAIVSSKMLLEMLRDRHGERRQPYPPAEELGALVRREVERALAAHDASRGRNML
jgi:hypothetical protein